MSSATTTTADDHGHDDHGHGHHGGPDHVPHVTPLPTYFAVFGTLLVLTAITYGVSYFNFGSANLIIALLVATVKATVVALWFMHLKNDERMNALLLTSAFVFLGIFIGLTAIDVLARGVADPMEARRVYDLSKPFDEKLNAPRKSVKVDPHAAHGEPAHPAEQHH